MVGQVTPRVNRPLEDSNYGREEYIEDCVIRIFRGEKVLISLGGVFSSASLPPVIREKYSAFFPGFDDALEEVKTIVTNRLGNPSGLNVREFRGGSNSDICGMPDSLDGHYVWLNEVKAKLG